MVLGKARVAKQNHTQKHTASVSWDAAIIRRKKRIPIMREAYICRVYYGERGSIVSGMFAGRMDVRRVVSSYREAW